jgi:hypothetical protein
MEPITMRLRPLRIALIAILLVVVGPALTLVYRWQGWFVQYRYVVEGLSEAVPSLTYVLETNRWLKFEIPLGSPFIKILSNANLTNSADSREIREWRYALEYRLLDSEGVLMHEQIYHLKTSLTLYTNRISGRILSPHFYLDRQLLPLNSCQMFINLTDPDLGSKARHLHLRLHGVDEAVTDVGIRIYHRQEVSAHKLGYLWTRLSADQKRDLARGNVYSFQGLSEQEKLHLLRYHWSGSAPEGIAGRDYARRTLYLREDLESEALLADWQPEGTVMDPRRWATLALPDRDGRLRLELRTNPNTSSQQTNRLDLRWFGRGLRDSWNRQESWLGDHNILVFTNQAGLLELQPAQETFLRAFLEDARGATNITPEPWNVPAYLCESEKPIEYEIRHFQTEHTRFRIDLRLMDNPIATNQSHPVQVHYALLRSSGDVVQNGFLSVSNHPSFYDCLQKDGTWTNVTEATSWFFVVPPEVTALRLVPQGDLVIVNAYNRSAGLVRKSRVPDDYDPARKEELEQPGWFSLRARDHEERYRRNGTALLVLQTRPPERDPLILAGRYLREALPSDMAVRGRMVLSPLAAGEFLRPETRPLAFHPISTDQNLALTFSAQPWETNVAPVLLILRHETAAQQTGSLPGFSETRDPAATGENGSSPSAAFVTVVKDGNTWLKEPLQGGISEFRLTPTAAGNHLVTVRCDVPVSVFINFLAKAEGPAWIKRMAVSTEVPSLRFTYNKIQAGAELLVIRLFTLWPAAGPCQVHARINNPSGYGLGPFASPTFPDRLFEVIPSKERGGILLGTKGDYLDAGQLMFLPVGADLPVGTYSLDVSVTGEGPHLMVVSRTTPGDYEERSFTIERR